MITSQKCGQVIDHNYWDDEHMAQATIKMMCASKGDKPQDTGKFLVQNLGKFVSDDFETHEKAFINLVGSNIWIKQAKS